MTIGKYVTPNHMDINGGGIEPDFRNLPGLIKLLNLDFLSFKHLNNSLTSGFDMYNMQIGMKSKNVYLSAIFSNDVDMQ